MDTHPLMNSNGGRSPASNSLLRSSTPPNGSVRNGQIKSSADMVRVYNYGPQMTPTVSVVSLVSHCCLFHNDLLFFFRGISCLDRREAI